MAEVMLKLFVFGFLWRRWHVCVFFSFLFCGLDVSALVLLFMALLCHETWWCFHDVLLCGFGRCGLFGLWFVALVVVLVSLVWWVIVVWFWVEWIVWLVDPMKTRVSMRLGKRDFSCSHFFETYCTFYNRISFWSLAKRAPSRLGIRALRSFIFWET